MRLYAFFALAQFALTAHAATIPDTTLAAQESLQKLQEGFISQIDTLTENFQTFLNGNRSNASPAEDQTKADLQSMSSGLNIIKNDFIKELKVLDDYIRSKATNNISKRNNFSSDAGKFIQTFITNFETNVQNGMANVTNSFNNYVIQDQNHQVSEAPAAVTLADAPAVVPPAENSAPAPPSGAAPMPPVETQADLSITSPISGIVKVVEAYESVFNLYNIYVKKPMQIIGGVGSVLGIKPTKTLLQDNPYKQRIAETVQKSQELENVKAVSGVLLSEDEKTELSPDSGE